MLYLFFLGCLNEGEPDRVDEPAKTVVEEVDDENKETEVLIAEVKDVSLDVRRRIKDNQTYFNVFFEEGVFRGEFVEKYDNQDLSSQNLLRMYVQRKGDKKRHLVGWFFVVLTKSIFIQKTSLSKKRQTNSLKYF